MFRASLITALCLALSGGPAVAFEPFSGTFLAREACAASPSIHKAGGDATRLRAGAGYPAVGFNKPGGDYIQVRVPGARPELRWVPLGCGTLQAAGGDGPALESLPAAAAPEAREAAPAGPSAGPKYLLALSWHPAFCQTRPGLAECKTFGAAGIGADHFVLHGLWPQPESRAYCGITARDRALDRKHGWDYLPEPPVSEETRRRLAAAMPGMASNLQRHEWIKHGSCFGGPAEAYYRIALHLLDQVNASKLREFMAASIGNEVAVGQLRDRFDQSFGPGAGAALAVRCETGGREPLVGELWIHLRGKLTDTTALADVLDTAAPARNTCTRARVDRVGLD